MNLLCVKCCHTYDVYVDDDDDADADAFAGVDDEEDISLYYKEEVYI